MISVERFLFFLADRISRSIVVGMAGNSPNRVYLVVAVVSVAIVTTAAFAFVQSRKAKRATKDKKKIEKGLKDVKVITNLAG